MIELLDASGAPRLRMSPPWIVDKHGVRHDAMPTIEGCAFDRDPSAPWGRAVVAPGAAKCTVSVSWDAALAYPALLDPTWVATGSMTVSRRSYAATVLTSGRVLASGGSDSACCGGMNYSSAELYDPVTKTWAATGSMVKTRSVHSIVALPGDTAVVLGGCDSYDCVGYASSTAEVFSGGVFTNTTGAPLGTHPFGIAITLTTGADSGKVLVANGEPGSSFAEIYDPGTRSFVSAGTTRGAGGRRAAARLPDGKVLVTGGATLSTIYYYSSLAEIYDPIAKTWTLTTPMSAAPHRAGHAMIELADGKVLAVGGIGGVTSTTNSGLSLGEVFDPVAKTWGPIADMKYTRSNWPFAVRLGTGKVLVAGATGGTAPASVSSELFDPSTGAWTSAANMPSGHDGVPLMLLASGKALIAGGHAGGFYATTATHVFDAKTVGETCAVNDDCGSGYCVDTVCCASACTGLCQACSAALTGGANGTCANVKAGTAPPRAGCAATATATCGVDGTCDGSGACRKWVSGTSCAAATCASASTVQRARACDGAGTCVDAGTITCPAAWKCAGGACATACTTADEATTCAAGHHCLSGACVMDLGSGTTCGRDGECSSRHCVDGVCCDTACTENCKACTNALKGEGTDGVCGNVLAGAVGRARCTKDPGYPASCKADGLCDGVGSCRLYAPKSISCGMTTCVAGTVNGPLCDGGGNCKDAMSLCDPYSCAADGKACRSGCSADADCAGSGFYCTSGGVCATKNDNGKTCAADKECTSAHCVDGVCCDAVCTGQCEACDVTGALGKCSPIMGSPHGKRSACAGAGSDCGGSCNGANPTMCDYPLAKACGLASCDKGASTEHLCDGKGVCVAKVAPCNQYACDVSAGKCKASCTVQTDCATGYRCGPDGTCSPAPTGTCSDDRASSTGSDGTVKQCSPYLCDTIAGDCYRTCNASTECQSGFVCDSKSCVPGAAADTASDSSCGCRTTGGSRGGGLLALVGMAIAVAGRRKVRSSAQWRRSRSPR